MAAIGESAALAPPKEGWRSKLRSARTGWWFMSPSAVLVIVFFFIPSIIIVGLSLTDMTAATGFKNWNWIGFENNKEIFEHLNQWLMPKRRLSRRTRLGKRFSRFVDLLLQGFIESIRPFAHF